MATSTLQTVCRQLRNLAGAQDAAGLTDRQLLQRFVETQDESAFATLLKRHGPMVLGVCRRVLGNAADADDAFQATFLVLARQATSIRAAEALPSWLYGTAYRSALALRRKSARRRTHEQKAQQPTRPDPELEAALGELQALLDEEVQRLPETLRAPFVLCCLEGLSKPEAAGQLGWKEGTVSGRLARARERLRQRLARRGVALPSALCALALTAEAALAAVPPTLAEQTLRAAASLAAGRGLVAGARVAAVVRQLTCGFLFARLKLLAALLLAAGLAIATAAGLAGPAQTPSPPAGKSAPDAAQVKEPDAEAAEAPRLRTDALGDPLPAGAVARLGTSRLRHGSAVKAVAYSADGKWLVSAGKDNVLRVWDAATGKALRALREDTPLPLGGAWCLALSPDRRTAAVGGDGGELALWDLVTGKLRERLKGHRSAVMSVAFSPDGKRLASAGEQTVFLWTVAGGKLSRRLQGHTEEVNAVAFSPGGKLLASASADTSVRLWDVATGAERRRLEGNALAVGALAFSPDGSLLATGGADKTIHLWDTTTWKEREPLRGHEDSIRSLAFSHDGKRLASAAAAYTRKGMHGELKLWDVAARKELPRPGKVTEPVEAVAFSPDGSRLAAALTQRFHIRLWDVATGKEVSLPGHRGHVGPAGVSADGRRVLAASYVERELVLWDAAGTELRRFPGTQGLLLPDGKTVLAVSSAEPDVLHVWDADTGKPVRQLARPAGGRTVGFSADGKLAASTGVRNGVAVWQVETGKELRRLGDKASTPLPPVLSADGTRVAAAFGNTVRVWDVASGKELAALDNGVRVLHIALSPDGRLLAATAATGPRSGRVWDVNTGGLRYQLNPEGLSVAFSPDGRTLVVGNRSGEIVLWEAQTGRERARLSGHEGRVGGYAFSPDGRWMATGSLDTTALLWDLARPAGAGPGRLTDAALKTLWGRLGEADAASAYQALLKLAAGADRAVPFLRAHLRPAKPGDTAAVERLLKDLGSEQFAVRQKATEELVKRGEGAEQPLRKALTGTLTPELQLRVRKALADLEAKLSAARLRAARALEALERAGTPEARRLLGELAAGAPGAWLTEQARGGVRRLGEGAGR